jgi:hypothetical protein
MKHIPEFIEFINESYQPGMIWFDENSKKRSKEIKISIGTAKKFEDDTVTNVPFDDFSNKYKSLGVKVDRLMTYRDSTTNRRYIAIKILDGPEKGSTLFCIEDFSGVPKTTHWYSKTPKIFNFKTVAIKTEPIPANLKAIHDEMIKHL